MQKNQFIKFNLRQNLIDKLNQKKIYSPTKIQEEVIPKILNKQDVIAQSKTGTGKTIAYLLPLIQMNEKVLIIAPTKELARQIYEVTLFFYDNIFFKTILLSTDQSIEKQSDLLKNDIQIIIGVPGRIIKLAELGKLKLAQIKKIVLDEADFLIDLGFLNDIKFIFQGLKNITQIMIFSATLSNNTKKIIDLINNQKYSVRIEAKNKIPENIENYFFPIEEGHRDTVLLKLIKNINPYLCIIFVRTKETSIYLFNILKKDKISVGCLNGDLSINQRKRSINDFKKGRFQYLVSTDLASRGLDIPNITHIINYNLPQNELDYLHRAGRTGRMNEQGYVYSLCNELDEGYLKKYSIQLDFKLESLKINKDYIEKNKNYKGVKPRFNLKELEKLNTLKKKVKRNKLKKKITRR